MNIFICLSNLLLGESLAALLQKELPENRVTFANGRDLPADYTPDLLLVDYYSLHKDLAARWSGAKLALIDTGLEEETLIALLLSRHLDGIIARDTDMNLFRRAVSAILSGQVWIDNGKLKALLNHIEGVVKNQQPEQLSRKEREIIKLISDGLKNKEIAIALYISEQTVKTHISRIFRKCNVSSRSQLIPLAMKFRNFT